MTKPIVFISYSHKDEIWKDDLITHMGVLQQENLLDLWDDRRISAGEDWYNKIHDATSKASIAILLISANFLTSKFILSEEIPRLLERRKREGVHIYPVIIKPCAWKQVKWLAQMNLRPKDGRPISGGNEHQIDTDLTAVAEEVAIIIEKAIKNTKVNDLLSNMDTKILDKFPYKNTEQLGTDKLPFTTFKKAYNFANNDMYKTRKEAEDFATTWMEKFSDNGLENFMEIYRFANNDMYKTRKEAEDFATTWMEQFINNDFEKFIEVYHFANNDMYKTRKKAEDFAIKQLETNYSES